MPDQFSRTRMLIGDDGVERLRVARVLLFGVGGVGSFAAEALARAGIGHLETVDNDTVSLTNLNRQLLALHSTLGEKKVDVACRRIRDINPSAEAVGRDVFVSAETISLFDFSLYDYVLDAVDTVSAKLLIAEGCQKAGTPLISSMGTGNKLDPARLRVCDVFETAGDPLARVMRRELKKRGIKALRVVCSCEKPVKSIVPTDEVTSKRSTPGSVSFVPSAAGLMMAGEAIRGLLGLLNK